MMNEQTDHRLRDNESFIEGWLDGFDKRHSSFMDYGEQGCCPIVLYLSDQHGRCFENKFDT